MGNKDKSIPLLMNRLLMNNKADFNDYAKILWTKFLLISEYRNPHPDPYVSVFKTLKQALNKPTAQSR